MSKSDHARQLILAGHKNPYIVAQSGVTVGTVYDLRFKLKHPDYRRKPKTCLPSQAPTPRRYRQSRCDLACELAERMTIAQGARDMGIEASTVRKYVATSNGESREKNEERPRCRCGLSLPCTCAEEDAVRGRPRRAEDLLGRRDEPVIGALTW